MTSVTLFGPLYTLTCLLPPSCSSTIIGHPQIYVLRSSSPMCSDIESRIKHSHVDSSVSSQQKSAHLGQVQEWSIWSQIAPTFPSIQ